MKKNYYIKTLLIVFSISILLVFQSCTKDTLNVENLQVELKDEPVVDKLIEMGYKLERIEELDDFYLVQGCLMFSKNIDDYNNDIGNHEKQASTNNLVSQANVAAIWVYIDPSLPTSGVDYWTGAIYYAMSVYREVPDCRVFFSPTHSRSAADIIIQSDNNTLPDNVIASAGFPSNNQPHNRILINLDYDSNKSVALGSKSYNMVHELGHCIGFRHTNWQSRGEGTGSAGANLIPGTPSEDPNSVMNGGTADNVFLGLSSYDIVSLKYLYPEVITLSSTVKNTGIFVRGGFNSFNVSDYPSNSTIKWQYSTGLRVIYGGSTGSYFNLSSLSSAGNSGWVNVTVTPPSGPAFFEHVNFTIKPEIITLSSTVKNTGIFVRGGFNSFNVSGYPSNSTIKWQHSTGLRIIYGGSTGSYFNLSSLSSAGNSGWVNVTVTPPSGPAFFERVNFTIQSKKKNPIPLN